MNKSVAFGLVAVVVLVGGFMFFKKGGDIESQLANTETSLGEMGDDSDTSSTNQKKMAFDLFVKQGGSYVCSVNQSINGVDSLGTVYVANGNMRGEFDTTVQGTKMTSSMIMKDGFMYSWSSASPNMGFKMAIPSETSAPNTGGTGTYGYNASQFGDYDCQPWAGDASKFSLPSSVKFTEMKVTI